MKDNPILKKLKQIRISKNISIRDMAKSLGVSKSMYSYIENGDKRLSYDIAVKISSFFDMSPDQIFQDDFKEFFKNNSHIIY